MTAPEHWTRLYLARWPDGAVTLLSAESLEHVADLLDQVGNAQDCEVVPFDGDLWLTMRPADDPSGGPLVLDHRPTIEADSQEEIVGAAFPALHSVLEAAQRETEDGDICDEPIDLDAWRAAQQLERTRILARSHEWTDALRAWWEHLTRSQDEDPSKPHQ